MKPVFILLILFAASFNQQVVYAQASFVLPRSLPEQQGVRSDSIQHFIDAIGRGKSEFHSFMLMRHGKVIAETWWKPYQKNKVHTMYSVSKSFTSTAIGLAIAEKKLSLADKVIDFFPTLVPDTVSANLSQLTIDNLLTMSVGHDPDPSPKILFSGDNWIQLFLATPLIHKPGTYFVYNTVATYVLSAIVQKVTGQTTMEYLRSRLFIPLGITDADWESGPQNISTGGWGLRLSTEDMTRFGELYLRKGMWNGKRILPALWVSAATANRIKQPPDSDDGRPVDSSDQLQGYGYQFWRCRYNSFRADGAFGQIILVMPDQDAVIAITSESMDPQEELNLIWRYLLPAMKETILPADIPASSKLADQLRSLSLPVAPTLAVPILEPAINKKLFTIESNDIGLENMSFSFDNANLVFSRTIHGVIYKHKLSSGVWKIDTTSRRGPDFLLNVKTIFQGHLPFATAGVYRWIDPNTLEMTLRYIESPHHESITCRFKNDQLEVQFQTSIDFGRPPAIIKGFIKH